MRFNRKYFPKTPFILAFSGGVDSLSVAHLFKSLNLDFYSVHVNHKFIDQDDMIAEKSKSFLKTFKIPFEIVESTDIYNNGSKEDFCRKVRYNLLNEVANRKKISHIVTAHHLDDCVESYLMNCFKGQPEYMPIPFITTFHNGNKLIRPFLTVPKSDFQNYSKKYELNSWIVEDELNSDLSLTRNWIRNQVIPMVSERYSGIKKTVFKRVVKGIENFSEKYVDTAVHSDMMIS